MKIRGWKTLRRSAHWLRSRIVNSAIILGYHRVAQVSEDPFKMCVSTRNFDEQLRMLRQYASPISLDVLLEGLKVRSLPERAVVLTFDDGYADVLHHAKPLLERYDIPATVFVSTGYLGREFWWDRLERIVYSSTRLPQQISLIPTDGTYTWSIQEIIDIASIEEGSGFRLHLLMLLYDRLLPLSSEARESAIDQLCALIDLRLQPGPNIRALTAEELIELSKGGLVDVGGHSTTHPILTALSAVQQIAEIEGSKSSLEEILGRPVIGFSYPHGLYSKETQRIVRDTGYSYACTSDNDVVWWKSERFQLPRFWISDRNGTTFIRWLQGWIRG